ncbi:MAG: cob(I)yrinic acid a,c-diamide adenosyltransferase [Chloroflexi bacterium]|nr:MAG: cob(I)yrinic acid a,c-diamide adenosyltransferase [Chloroflexota bacterium]
MVTRGGDGGETGLLYGGRVRKTDSRTEAYGAVDEAISALGLARAQVRDRGRAAAILRLQEELFTVGAELATDPAEYETLRKHFLVITPAHTGRLEEEVHALEAAVALPDAFVVPGGSVAGASLDLARTVVRRAERRIVALADRAALPNPELLRYVNRLSDLVFMLARAEEGSAQRALRGRRVVRRPAAPDRIRKDRSRR